MLVGRRLVDAVGDVRRDLLRDLQGANGSIGQPCIDAVAVQLCTGASTLEFQGRGVRAQHRVPERSEQARAWELCHQSSAR